MSSAYILSFDFLAATRINILRATRDFSLFHGRQRATLKLLKRGAWRILLRCSLPLSSRKSSKGNLNLVALFHLVSTEEVSLANFDLRCLPLSQHSDNQLAVNKQLEGSKDCVVLRLRGLRLAKGLQRRRAEHG